MADTLARMSADTTECDEAQVQFNTHLEQLASSIRKRSHLVNVDAQQVEPADRPPRTQPRPLAGSKRERLLQGHSTRSLRPTTTSTASPSMPRSQLLAPARTLPGNARRTRHRRHRAQRVARVAHLTFLDDRRTWLCTACEHVSRLRALKLAQPCPRVFSKVGRRNVAAIQNGRQLD